jgi:hypothetical protein
MTKDELISVLHHALNAGPHEGIAVPGDCSDEDCRIINAVVRATTPPKSAAEVARNKTDVLNEALKTVADRGASYGTVEENFNRIAARWTAHVRNRYDNPRSGIAPLSAFPAFDAFDVAIMMADVKLARLELDPTHHDSWVDVAGYAGCGGELAAEARNSA